MFMLLKPSYDTSFPELIIFPPDESKTPLDPNQNGSILVDLYLFFVENRTSLSNGGLLTAALCSWSVGPFQKVNDEVTVHWGLRPI